MKSIDIYSWDPKLKADPIDDQRKKFRNNKDYRLFCDFEEHYQKIRDKFPERLQKEYDEPIEYSHNNLGFRDHRDIQDTNEGILAIGDSFTEGEGVRYEHIWTRTVEKELNTPVYNFGASNTGLDEWFRIFLRFSKKFTDNRVLLLTTYFSRYSLPQEHHYMNPNWIPDLKEIWNYYFVSDNHVYYNYQVKLLAMYQLAHKFNKKLFVVNINELLDNPLMHDNSWWYSGRDHSGKYDLARDGKHLGKNFQDDVARSFLKLLK